MLPAQLQQGGQVERERRGDFRRPRNGLIDLRVVVHATRNTDVADGCNVVLLPLPYVRARKVRRRPTGTRTFGYLGLASEAKGFVAMAEAIALVRHRTERARFVIQTNPRPEPATLSAIERLRKLAVSTDGIDLLDGPLSDAEYDETFAQVDFMLLPHHAAAYANDESGVFLECVASGMPVIASNETAMGARVASAEAAGWLFEDGNGGSLADAILRAALDDDIVQPNAPSIADPAQDFADLLVGAFATAQTEPTRLTHSPIGRSTYRTS